MFNYFKIALSFLSRWALALGVPWIWIQFFGGEGTVEFFLSWSLWSVFLTGLIHYLKKRFIKFSIILMVISIIVLSIGGLIFFSMAAFSPVEAYSYWLKAIQTGPAPGVVSFQLGILLGFISTTLAVLSWNTGLKSAAFLLTLILTAAGFVIFPHYLWILGFLGAILGLYFSVSWGGKLKVSKLRASLEAAFLPLVVLILSLPLVFSPFKSSFDSPEPLEILRPLGEEFVDPGLWTLVADTGEISGSPSREAPPPRIKSPLLELQGRPQHFYYLRAQIYDYFTGKNWQRYAAILNSPTIFLNKKLDFKPDLTLKVTAELLPLIPHPLDTLDTKVIPLASGKTIPAQFLPQGIRLDHPLVRGDEILLAEGSGSTFEAHRMDPTYGLQGIQMLNPTVRKLFNSLEFFKNKAPEVFIPNLLNWLNTNYTYVLKTPSGEGTPLERFLLSSKYGYSIHFATAAVMALRYQGIPARFVRGYAIMTDEAGQGEVTTLNAHDWVEFYVPQAGWVTLEACPPFSPSELVNKKSLEAYDQQKTREQIAFITGRAGKETPVKDLGSLVWIASLVLILLSTVIGIIFYRIRSRGTALQKVKEPKDYLPAFIKRLVKKSLKRNFPLPEQEGWLSWIANWKNIRHWIPERLNKRILPLLYNKGEPTPRDTKLIRALRRML